MTDPDRDLPEQIMWAGRFITAKTRGRWEYVSRARGFTAALHRVGSDLFQLRNAFTHGVTRGGEIRAGGLEFAFDDGHGGEPWETSG